MAGFKLGDKALAAGYRLAAFDSVGSTSTEAAEAAAQGDPGKIWFLAREQTAGRGRRGRAWQDIRGNLASSLLVRPECDMSTAATLGFVAGVSVAAALKTVLSQQKGEQGAEGIPTAVQDKPCIQLKWPNDALVDGGKICGILLESRGDRQTGPAIAIGIGINVVSAPQGLSYPTSFAQQFDSDISAETVFEALSDAWVEVYDLWDNGQGIETVLLRWRQSAAGIGAPVAVQNGADIKRGIFETIDDAGRLVIRDAAGHLTTISAGDVHFGLTASALSGNNERA